MTTDATAQPHDHPHDAGEHLRSLFTVYFCLMVLLVLTVVAAFAGERWHFGTIAIVIALAIAVVKASMVVWVFMHVKSGGKLLWVFASAAFVWLAIMFAYSLADYESRNLVPKGQLIERASGSGEVQQLEPTISADQSSRSARPSQATERGRSER